MVSPMISPLSTIGMEHHAMLAGCIGDSTAIDFIQYCSVYANVPKITDIIANPLGIQVDRHQAGVLVATVSMCARHDDLSQWNPIITFIKTLPVEMQSWFVMQAIRYHGNNARRVSAFNDLSSDVGTIMY